MVATEAVSSTRQNHYRKLERQALREPHLRLRRRERAEHEPHFNSTMVSAARLTGLFSSVPSTGLSLGRDHCLQRTLFVEVAWIMRQHNPHAAALCKRPNKGAKTGRKQATVALGRCLLTWCWVMLRDETTWDAQKVVLAV